MRNIPKTNTGVPQSAVLSTPVPPAPYSADCLCIETGKVPANTSSRALDFPEKITNSRPVARTRKAPTLKPGTKPLPRTPTSQCSRIARGLHFGKNFNHSSDSSSWRHGLFSTSGQLQTVK